MIAAILGFLSCCVLLSNIFPVFLVMALPCPSSSLPTGSNSSASSSLASANLSDNPPGYDTLMNSQLPSYDDSIVQKTNLPAQVLRNTIDEKLFLTILPSSLLSFFHTIKFVFARVLRWGWCRWSRRRRPRQLPSPVQWKLDLNSKIFLGKISLYSNMMPT